MPVTLDAGGLVCPLPVLKARKVLLAMPAGETIKVFVTDTNAPRDFELFCAENNYRFDGVFALEEGFDIVITKT